MYTETILWKKAFEEQNDSNNLKREKLKIAFMNARQNASYILEKIHNDFPSLTVHDISHVDSLWQVGSVIVGEEYDINPLEGFVLGCAFLMHDAVLSYEAAGGKKSLRETTIWKDYYADYKKNESLSEQEKIYEADFKTIRFLHAEAAQELYSKVFLREDNSEFYIIEDELLRNHLGEIICEIASSHHWDIEKVEELGIQIPAISGYPREWNINPLKLSCILRCADAGHIDAGRAPDYLLKLLQINGVSRSHWIAQNRLSQIDIDVRDKSKVVIKSNIKFKEEDFEAWNVAYDAVCVLDHEIKQSNDVLRKNGVEEFQIKGVSGAGAQETLCEYIKTDGWSPCDAKIHISNVEDLIKNLGGEKLYGKQHKLEIVLRELIQNSRDAIVARRKMDRGFNGSIHIKINNIEGKIWVTVQDDGVGMSLNTIKDYFLNFGASFWASDLAKSEYPGLNSSGYNSVGRFGIGFYSIFMVASQVIVETRKYNKGLDDVCVVKFPSGLSLRPVMAKTSSDTSMVSTSISFLLDENKCHWNREVKITPNIQGASPFVVPYFSVLANLTAGLDVNVFYSELGESEKQLHSDIEKLELGTDAVAEWLKDITYARYRANAGYAEYIDENFKRVTKIEKDGKVYGLAALNTFWQSETSYFDVTTIGGLSNFSHSSDNAEFLGVLLCEPETAKRDGNFMPIDKTAWAKEQYDILRQQGLSAEDKIYLPYVLGKYEIDMTDEIMIRVFSKTNIISEKMKNLLLYAKDSGTEIVFALSNYIDDLRLENYLDYERTLKGLSENQMLFIVEKNSGFLGMKEHDEKFPYNIWWCINKIAEKNSLIINKRVENDKAISRLGGKCKGIIIGVV